MIGMILAAIFAIAGLVVIILNNLHSHKMTHYIVRSDRDELTVEEFIALTRNAYGGEVIRKLEEALARGVGMDG